MHKRNVTAAVIFALVQSAFAADAPQVILSVAPPFATEITVKHYHKGQDLLHDPTFHLVTSAPLTEYHGWFGPRNADQANNHWWKIDVFARYSERVAAAFTSAKDGYQADLNIEPEFFGFNERSYMFARFEHKRFKWGDAVSFLSQFTQDPTLFVPHNGHLTYEIWGLTPDRKFTVVAMLSVSHTKLGNWGSGVRVASSMDALKRDKDYKRVEKCDPEEFDPSLTAFDRLLETLVIR